MKTHFLPPGKETFEKVLEQNAKFEKEIGKTIFLNVVPVIYLVLNSKRQVVWANRTACEALNFPDKNSILGKRIGELFQCAHAFDSDCSYGTTEFCKTCGAAIATKEGLLGEINFQECRIEQKNTSEALDLKVTSIPYDLEDESFVVFTVVDISHEKRRQALERIFFHDIANTAGNINGFLSILDPANTEEFNSDLQILNSLSQDILDEINAQKILFDAENCELNLTLSEINSYELLDDLIQKYKRHEITNDKTLLIKESAANINFKSDTTLLKRAIGNMIKNALEASNPGNKITVSCDSNGKNIEFWVHNESFMLREIQLQLFHRSFSSKGKGRGLGTYSMKLLAERYLGGNVTFTSSEQQGTKFKISLPFEI